MVWKIYFWILAVLVAIGLVVMSDMAPLWPGEIVGLLFELFLLTSLFAYIYKKDLFKPHQWKWGLWISLALYLEALIEIFIISQEIAEKYLWFLQVRNATPESALIGMIIYIPAIIALYRLSHPKKSSSRR